MDKNNNIITKLEDIELIDMLDKNSLYNIVNDIEKKVKKIGNN